MNGNFDDLIKGAIKKLPDHIRQKMDNVAVCVEDEPSDEQLKKTGVRYGESLLGLYQGVPKNIWGRGFGNSLPDKITIFKKPIKKMTSDPERLEEIIGNVVWHEIAHHFGFDENEVRRLEKEKK